MSDNQAPIAADDNVAIAEDSGAIDLSSQLLANDSDPDNDGRTITTATSAAHGTVSVLSGVLTYTPDGDYNGSDSFTYTIDDGNGHQDTAIATVTVTAVNDPLTSTAPVTASLNEDDVNFSISGLSISDVDATLAPAGVYEVTLSSTNGALTLTTLTGLTFTSGDGNNDISMTLHGTLSDINTALATAQYTPAANYGGSAEIDFQVTDSFGGIVATGTGAATNDTDVVDVTVTPVNDTPVLSDSPAISVDEQTATIINAALAVSDADLDARNGGNGDYSGATFTVGRSGGTQAEDLLAFGASGSFTVNGSNLEAPGGLVFATFTGGNGADLVITFNSSGTPATSELVNDVLQHLQYTNTSDAPPASVTLAYLLNDGAPANASQGPGTAVDSGEVVININPVDEVVTSYQPTGGEFIVNSVTQYQQSEPQVAELATGGFVVTWQGDGIRAQIFAADGSPIGDEFTIASGGRPTITGLEGGGFVVSWEQSGIMAQIYGADGSAAGDAFLVNVPKADWLFQPTIAALSGGGFVVSWTDQSGDGNWYGIRAQIFDASGTAVGSEFVVNSVVASEQVEPAITGLAGGGFVVSWTDYSGIGGDNNHSGVKAQIFASDGSRIGDEFLVNTATNSQQSTATITALSNGGFVVSWFDYSWTGGDPEDGAVKAQIYGADGTALGSEFLVNTTTVGQQGQPSASALSDGGFVIAWMDGSNVTGDNPDWDIRAQAFSADGSKVGGEILVNTITDFYQNFPSVSSVGDGGFVVTWADYSGNTDFSNSEIKAQIFEPLYGGDEQLADARDDEFTTDELSLITGNLFADNGSGADNDPDGQPLTIVSVNGSAANVGTQFETPSGALLTVNSDGTFSYDPNGAFEYTPALDSGGVNTPTGDTFSYTLAGGDTATVVLTINGVDNNDTVVGSDGVDVLTGGVGNDIMFGLDGDDLLRGRTGDDYIDGGDGFDRAGYYHLNEAAGGVHIDLTISGEQDTGSQGWDTLVDIEYVSGTPFADVLIGDENANVLWGSTATIDPGNWVSATNNDTLDGAGGDDLLYVGIGNHTLTGGTGNDTLGFTENFGDDPAIIVDLRLQGQAQDTGAGLWTLSGIENLSGGNDNDQLIGDFNANILAGSFGNDILTGNGGNDTLYGDGAIDTASPTSGAPTLFPDLGANGNDTLSGGAGDDTLYGGGGNDRLVGGGNNDNLYGEAGNDYLTGGFGDDYIDGGDSIDRAGWYQTDPLLGGATADLTLSGPQNTGSQGWDTLVSIEYLSGTPFADHFVGDDNNNILWGSAATYDPGDGSTVVSTSNNDYLDGAGGNDLLSIGIGNHTLIGGTGNDTLSFGENGANEPGVAIALWENLAQDTGAGTWTLSGIENVFGGVGNDILEGDDEANVIGGSLGGDQLWGYGGDDTLYGDGYVTSINNVATAFADAGAEGGNDTIRAGAGNDIVYGGAGNDFINGGTGDDFIDGGDGYDRAAYFDNSATSGITVDLRKQGEAQYVGEQGWDTLVNIEAVSGNSFADNITGDDNNNWLWGSVGGNGGTNNDTIDGQGGNDLITVGIGNHTLTGGTGNDTLEFSENGGAEPGISVALWEDLAQNTGAGTWTLSGFENLFGGIADDSLEGDDFDNIIGGSLGSDLLFGYGGNDTLYGDGYVASIGNVETQFVDSGTEGGDDQLFGGGGNDTMYGGAGNDFLQANAGNDILHGGIGNDYLGGGTGDDYMDGGDGWDRASFSNGSTGPVAVDLRIQGAQNTGLGLDTLVNIENVTGTAYGDTLIGDDGANWLWGAGNAAGYFDTIDGQGGDDLIEVGAGDHVLSGGIGIDTLSYNPFGAGSVGASISLELQGASQDTGGGAMTIDGFENLSGSDFDDSLTGDGNANLLAGSQGNDTLSGGAGNDTLYGDGVVGTDGSPSGPIATFTDVGALGGVDGNDTLEGGLGDDVIDGGGGADTASYANAGGSVEVFLYKNGGGSGESAGADGFDLLYNIENIAGSAFSDQLGGNNLDNVISGGDGNDGLRGNGGDDTLYGGDGNDFLNGSAGNDIVDGGAGFDRAAFYEDATENGVTVDLNLQGQAQDTGQGMDTLIGIENVSGSIYGDHLTGDGGDNWLWGSASTLLNGTIVTTNNDTLDGGGGNDLLTVGIGNHSLTGGTGIDTVRFSENGAPETAVTISLLLAGISQDTGNGFWTLNGIENLSGGQSDDHLTGDAGGNVLAGDSGNDLLEGGGGNDVLYGDGAIVVNATGSGPIETFADVTALGQSDGDDTLDGGAGSDQIYGGGGRDTASYASATGNVSVFLYDATYGEAYGANGFDQLHNIENLSGSAFNDILYGNDEDNVISGGNGHDDVRGGGGNDQVYGGDGDDLLYGNAGDDLIDGGAGYDRAGFFSGATAGVHVDLNLQGQAQDTGQGMDTLVNIENLSGTQFGDTLIGDGGDNVLWGSAATVSGVVSPDNNDTLIGNGGNDLLVAGIGNHSINGGTGTDTFRFTENGAPETGITLSLLLAGQAQVTANGTWTLTGIENLSGSIAADTLTGDGGSNVLAGDLGNDTLIGGGGNDTLYGDGQIGWDGHGAGRSGPITTWADATSLYVGGIAGNDILEGGSGNDTLDGGGGLDTATYAHASGGVTVNLASGTASGADGNDTLANIENVTGSEFGDTITGNGSSNVIDGLGGNDSLSGGAGDDTIYGGDGDDIVNGDLTENNVTVSGNDLLYGGNGNDLLRGGLGNDTLYGGSGNDNLRGNGGVDYFDGGADDGEGLNGIGDRVSFFEQRATQGVVADLRTGTISNDGFGNVETMVGIESLGAGTAFADTFYGNDNRNYLAGDRGDSVYGFGGDDIFGLTSAAAIVDGGTGTDRLALFSSGTWLIPDTDADGLAEFAAAATAGWSVNLAAGSIVDGYGNLGSVTGIENVDGNFLNDTLVGDGNANILNGGNGDDMTEGRAGNDTLDGGNGVDTASYANASGSVTVTLTATGGSSSGADGIDTLLNIENVAGGAFNDSLTGNGGINVLSGGGGNDTLNGAAENDTIDGGTGTDTASYANASGAVTVTLTASGGSSSGADGADTLVSIENIIGGAFDDSLKGNAAVNLLTGGTGNDTLEGGAGNDTLDGGTGADTASYANASAAVTVTLTATGGASSGADGADTLVSVENVTGGAFNDTITGNAGVNILRGGGGVDNISGGDGDDLVYGGDGADTLKGDKDNDSLYGGAGNDTLVGGQGNDRYIIEANSGADTISGFAHVDRIVFDASSGVTQFSQLTLTKVGGTNTLVTWGNGNSITITGFKPTDLSSADFEFSSSPASFASLSTMEVQRSAANSGANSILLGAVAASGLASVTSQEVMESSVATVDAGQLVTASVDTSSPVPTGSEMGSYSQLSSQFGESFAELPSLVQGHGFAGMESQISQAIGATHSLAVPSGLLEATSFNPGPAMAGFTSNGVAMPAVGMAPLVGEHGAIAAPNADIGGQINLAAILDSVSNSPDSIDALLSTLPGQHDGLSGLAMLPGDHGMVSAVFGSLMPQVDISLTMITHHDAVSNT